MSDPYRKLYESLSKDINEALTKLANMIDFIAKRTMTTKDYLEFMDEFAEKKRSEVGDLLK